MSYLIKNIKIYDGSGEKPYVADVLTEEEKISKIGRNLEQYDANIIDGTGLCLSPGFIDAHTHSDAQLYTNPSRYAKLKMGVTTEIGGQCGWSRAPYAKEMPEDAWGYLTTVYGDPNVVRCYETFKEQFEDVSKMKLGANQKFFMGHHMIRGSVIGMADRPATDAELKRMCELLEEGMKDGCLGLSSGLVYSPGIYCDTRELTELCKVVKKYNGIYTTHMRDEAAHVKESVKESIDVAKAAGCPLNISHLKALFKQNWDQMDEILDMITKAKEEGVDISFDAYPYEASSATILSTLPPSYNSHGIEWTIEHLQGRENIEILRDIIDNDKEQWENPIKNMGLENMLVTKASATPEAEGKRITEYAQLKGIDPLEAYAEIIVLNKGKVTDVRFNMSTENLVKIYKHPLAMVGTDGLFGGATRLSHPRHFGSFPRYLGRFVRDMGILPFEEGIRRVTSMPAQRYRVEGKGFVKEGYDADLVIFDENTIIDHSDYSDPFIPNEGIKMVFVGGGIAVMNNIYTGLCNGKPLK